MKKDNPLELRAAAPDFLRVISIAMVAWYHFWQQSWLNPNFILFGKEIDIYPLIRGGYMFVYNLILISGFVLMLNRLNGRYRSVWTFYKSRAIRILPGYLFCILVFLFVSNMQGGNYDYSGGREHMRFDLLSHLTFTHNLFYRSYNGTGLNVALWTVAVEVQFYALFPLISKAFERKPVITYVILLVISFSYKAYVRTHIEDSTLYINRLPAMLDVFANGMMSAYLFHKLRNTRQLGVVHFILGAAAMAGMCLVVMDVSYTSGGEPSRSAQTWGASLFSFFGSVFLISGSLCHKAIKRLLSNTVIRFLGGISYSFYIWHQPIAVWLKKLHIPEYAEEYPNVSGNVVWQRKYMLLCAVCALVAAFRVTYLIEKPCARWLNAHRLSDVKKLLKMNKEKETTQVLPSKQ